MSITQDDNKTILTNITITNDRLLSLVLVPAKKLSFRGCDFRLVRCSLMQEKLTSIFENCTSLSFDSCVMRDDSFNFVAEALKSCQLDSLQIICTPLDSYKFQKVMDIINSMESLHVFSLSLFKLSNSHSRALSNMLESNIHLKTLSISRLSMELNDFHLIMHGLAKNSSIENLIVSHNQLNKCHLPFILNLMKQNSSIIKYDFSYNKLNKNSVIQLIEAVKNSGIISFKLAKNPVSKNGNMNLSSLLKSLLVENASPKQNSLQIG